MWSTDSLGWKGYTKKQILQRVLDGRKRGAVYLFHVGSQSKDDPALQSIISELRKQGYGFVTINKRLLPPL
jgi:peptidoglycan/xylan/chitin deacetylase (PgdA/CDA1 family)